MLLQARPAETAAMTARHTKRAEVAEFKVPYLASEFPSRLLRPFAWAKTRVTSPSAINGSTR